MAGTDVGARLKGTSSNREGSIVMTTDKFGQSAILSYYTGDEKSLASGLYAGFEGQIPSGICETRLTDRFDNPTYY